MRGAAVLLVTLLICLGGCTPGQNSVAYFTDIPDEGWTASQPLKIQTDFPDSTATVAIDFAVRYRHDYAYGNMCFTVDMIDSAHHVTRRNVALTVADDNGNMTGTGFGTLYQMRVRLHNAVPAQSVSEIVIWQSMKGVARLRGIENVGIFLVPKPDKPQ